jgi:hypothetical protein
MLDSKVSFAGMQTPERLRATFWFFGGRTLNDAVAA